MWASPENRARFRLGRNEPRRLTVDKFVVLFTSCVHPEFSSTEKALEILVAQRNLNRRASFTLAKNRQVRIHFLIPKNIPHYILLSIQQQ